MNDTYKEKNWHINFISIFFLNYKALKYSLYLFFSYAKDNYILIFSILLNCNFSLFLCFFSILVG